MTEKQMRALLVLISDFLCLPPNIIPGNSNEVVHFCWDNFDLLEETPSGANTTHTCHGIAIQELKPGAGVVQ